MKYHKTAWLFAALALLGLATAVFLWKRPVVLTLAGASWRWEVPIEDYRPRRQSAWCDAMPRDAYGVAVSRRTRSCQTRKIGDVSYVDCERDDWCTFTVDRWAYVRSVVAEGGTRTDPPPRAPAYTLSGGDEEGYGRERALSRVERYTLQFAGEEEVSVGCSVSRETWERVRLGAHYEVWVGVLTWWPDCAGIRAIDGRGEG